YLNIHFLFKILVTLPVSFEAFALSFFALKRLKSYCRNSMNEERLNRLALLSVHWTIDINIDEVINELPPNKENLIFLL
ncbi:52 kDa repressor of the inhibitor of the protein kinase-like, partial [Aphis craccivora]